MKYLTIFAFFILSSCSLKRDGSGDTMPLDRTSDVHIINLDNIQTKKDTLRFSDIFSKATPIVLETTDESLIGNVTVFQVYNGLIYILDESIAKSLFVFDMDGRFIRKIGRIGNGPGEYIGISDFTINPDKEEIYLLDINYRMHKYKMDGTFIRSIKLYSDHAAILYIQYYNQKLYTDIHSFTYTDDDYLLQELNLESGRQEKRFLKTSEYNKGWNEMFSTEYGFFISKMNGEPKYVQLFMDTIVAIGKQGVTPFLAIESKDLTTKHDIDVAKERNSDVSERYRSFMETNKKYGIYNYIENEHFIYFQYRIGMSSGGVLYNVSDRIANNVGRIENNLVYKSLNEVVDPKFRFADQSGAYECVAPMSLPRLLKQIKQDNIVSNLENKDILLTLTEDSNPVIFYYEYKK